MAKKSCCCSSVRSCFSCFSAPNNPTSPSSPPPDTTLDASSPRVDPQTRGSSSSGIPAAVKHDDSRPHESAGGSSPSKVPSAHPFEPAKVPTMVAKDDILQDHDSRHNVVSIATSSSQADASANDKVGEGSSSSSKNDDDATLRTAPDLTSKIVKDVDGEIVDLDGLIKHISELLDIIQVKEMMLHRKVVCLYGGYESESEMKEFTCLIRNAFIRLRDNIHIIYAPNFIFKAAEERPVTDNAEMEGMLLLNLSQHDALTKEVPEMYNRDTDKLGALEKLLQCLGNENPWMILMDEEGNTITESGRKLVSSCKGSTEDEARGLIELLMKGSKEQRKEAVFKLEQMPDVENYDG